MNDLSDPMSNLDPLDKSNPLEDHLLDAVEHNIENQPGFVDPLVENESPLMDDLAKQLDAVEANIENAIPITSTPGPAENPDETGIEDDELPVSEAPCPVEDLELSDVTQVEQDSGQSDKPHDSISTFSNQDNLSAGHHFRLGSRGIPTPGKPGPSSKGRSKATISRSTRICPESHEQIDESQCQNCEKYRHWPDGTDEEPRECWYDWHAGPSGGNFDDTEEQE